MVMRQQLKAHLRRDVVNHGATLDGFNLEFVIVCHCRFPLQCQFAIQNQCQ